MKLLDIKETSFGNSTTLALPDGLDAINWVKGAVFRKFLFWEWRQYVDIQYKIE